jgi:hypothetical protein
VLACGQVRAPRRSSLHSFHAIPGMRWNDSTPCGQPLTDLRQCLCKRHIHTLCLQFALLMGTCFHSALFHHLYMAPVQSPNRCNACIQIRRSWKKRRADICNHVRSLHKALQRGWECVFILNRSCMRTEKHGFFHHQAHLHVADEPFTQCPAVLLRLCVLPHFGTQGLVRQSDGCVVAHCELWLIQELIIAACQHINRVPLHDRYFLPRKLCDCYTR